MLTVLLQILLFSLVIAGGVYVLLLGMSKGNKTTLTNSAWEKKKLEYKIIGSSLIGVGLLGLILSGYMKSQLNKAHTTTSSNFGFRFY